MPTWIKLRDDLDTDPRIFTMAAKLRNTAIGYILTSHAKDLFGNVTEAVTRNVMRDVTVAALSRVWFAANRHTTDGVFRNATLDYLDTLAQVPGFGYAMESVGYAVYDVIHSTVTLPRFQEYNAPDKNGERSKTAAARRQQRLRDRKRAESADVAEDPPSTTGNDGQLPSTSRDSVTSRVTPSVTPSHGESDVTPSLSISLSLSKKSESGKEESRGENPLAGLDALEAMKVKINALSPRWKKFPRWNDAEEHVLAANISNLFAADEQDFGLIAYWLRWAASPANTNAKEPVTVTASRAAIAERFPDYLERATRHWKQQGCPRLNPDGTKAAAKVLTIVPPPAEPELPPSANAAAFAGLLRANGVNHTPKVPTVTTNPAAASA